ncbi:Fpg/Nei family DNA glycosylase [Nocardioides marinquilinus]|uniref:DNA-(apurinic or apyrimidinic site) lyase n=1 Tax=Nocardioides marinquilinus TaxID=1210400 RepID=A0ABP9PYX8_9ACTN
MPEGHTLHRLARDLGVAFAGRRVRVSSPQGRFAASAALLDGRVLVGAEAWGKQLFVELEGDPPGELDGERFVHVHLGLIGTFDVHTAPAGAVVPDPVGQVRLRLVADDADADGTDDDAATTAGPTAWADLRGAIVCDLVTAAQRDAVVARMGPDPLRPDADPDRAFEAIRRSRKPIGALLMDQSVLAGVGNVYRAEVLFRDRLHPLRPGNTLQRSRWQALWDDLVALMPQGVATGRIDTVRPEHSPVATGRAPRRDDHGGEVYVYRRTGQPCLVCGRRVATAVLEGRNLFWCSRCQPVFRSRAVG